jgi:hypothetical protein
MLTYLLLQDDVEHIVQYFFQFTIDQALLLNENSDTYK